MTTYKIGTIAHCNRCDKAFELTRERDGGELVDTTARLQDFETCPHCGRMDSHWIYARDYQTNLMAQFMSDPDGRAFVESLPGSDD